MSIIKKIVLGGALCSLFGVATMFADTFSTPIQTCTITASTPLPTTSTCASLTKFDSSLGNLLSVTITLVAGGTVTPSVFNSSNTTSYGFTNAHSQVSVTFTGPDAATLFSGEQNSGNCSQAALAILTYANCSGASSTWNYSGSTSATNLLAWEANGGGALTGILLNGTLDLATGNPDSSRILFGTDGTIGATLQIMYTYSTTTPEPATMFLMGGALLGLGILTKKKRA